MYGVACLPVEGDGGDLRWSTLFRGSGWSVASITGIQAGRHPVVEVLHAHLILIQHRTVETPRRVTTRFHRNLQRPLVEKTFVDVSGVQLGYFHFRQDSGPR